MDEIFLECLRAALRGVPAQGLELLTGQEWSALVKMAQRHNVLPLVYEAVCREPGVRQMPELKALVRQQVLAQIVKTGMFLELYQKLLDAGVTALVVKGIVCRELYPEPDQRPSGDEDLLVRQEEFDTACRVLEAFGMEAAVQGDDAERTYRKTGSPLVIELHRELFPGNEAYGGWNPLFDGVFSRAVRQEIQGIGVYTMGYTDHLFYLLCHALKHFMHSGFGIRQVCDIAMYANAYGSWIDWESLLENCRRIHGERFAAALLRIGEKNLIFDPEKAGYPICWREIRVDETAMLEDLLAAGIHGGATMDRKHSSNMTLDAVRASSRGKKSKATVWGSLFPGAKVLQVRYPWLKDHPWLLPAAWADRLVKYRREAGGAAESVKIGTRRVELLRQYGVIQ